MTSDGRFKFAGFNPAAEKAVGYSNADICGKFVEEAVPEDMAKCVTANYRRCVQTGTLTSYEEELNFPTGRRYFHTNLIPIRNDAGEIRRIIGVARDVTQQKRAERALQVSEQRLDLAQTAAGIGSWDWDIAANETRCSSKYGLPPSEFAPAPEQWFELLHSEDRERIREQLNQVLESKAEYNTEFRVVWPDGTVHWLIARGQVFRDTNGRPVRMLGVNMDIDERKHAEQALRESEERFRNMADTAPVMIWVSGPDKLCTFFNKGWLAFTGRTLEQELGNGWSDGVHPDDLDRCFNEYTSSFDARRNFQMEYRLRRADGEYRWILDTGVPRFEPDETFGGYIGSAIDIHELRQTHEENSRRQKLESIGVLAGGIAHDFNNLLGSILADAEIAESELRQGFSPVEEMQRIQNVSIRAAEIVRELMIYSGQDKATLEVLDLSLVVGEMLELLKISISKRATLEARLEENFPAMRGSPTQIRQVVMNLIINASEAMGDKEGVIKVATSHVAATKAFSSNGAANLPEGEYVCLEVSDTGSGMPDEVKNKIFDPFFSTKFSGRGLGLAVVQGIVRGHFGIIDVMSSPGAGTTFRVFFPASQDRVEQRSNGQNVSQEDTRLNSAVTALVVEDEETLRLATSKVLRKKGFHIIEAADGSAAINLLRNHKNNIDLMLLDLTIPGSPSREVLAEAGRIRPNIKIILTTAYAQGATNERVDAPQIRGFIRKPYQLAELVQVMRTTMSSKQNLGG